MQTKERVVPGLYLGPSCTQGRTYDLLHRPHDWLRHRKGTGGTAIKRCTAAATLVTHLAIQVESRYFWIIWAKPTLFVLSSYSSWEEESCPYTVYGQILLNPLSDSPLFCVLLWVVEPPFVCLYWGKHSCRMYIMQSHTVWTFWCRKFCVFSACTVWKVFFLSISQWLHLLPNIRKGCKILKTSSLWFQTSLLFSTVCRLFCELHSYYCPWNVESLVCDST